LVDRQAILRHNPPGGVYRRAVALTGTPGQVHAEMEDDFHRFGVIIQHDGVSITGIEGHADRFPWTTCGLATDRLDSYVGTSLPEGVDPLVEIADLHWQCTHLADLVRLAAAHARRGTAPRRYDVTVADAAEDGSQSAEVCRDGVPVFRWSVKAGTIRSPDPFTGQSLKRLPQWVEKALDADEIEAALVLRRAVHIAGGRRVNLDLVPDARVLGRPGTCYSFQPSIAPKAHRVKGSSRDFSDADPQDLLSRKKQT